MMVSFRRARLGSSRLLAFALAPILMVQGGRVLATTPRLEEAGGPKAGEVHGRGTPIALLVIGESTAVGVGVDHLDDAVVGELARLMAAHTGRPIQWRVIGRNGARLQWDPARVLPDVVGEYDCAVVLLGVNDALGLTPRSMWRLEMSTLLRRVQEHTRPGGLVVLGGVPRLDTFPALPQPMRFVMGQHAQALDDVLRELSDAGAPGREPGETVWAHVPTPPMENATDLAADGFHPSAQGYRRWAQHMFVGAIRPWLERLNTL